MKNYELRITNYMLRFKRLVFAALNFYILIFLFVISSFGQSTSIEYPTAVSTNEISGSIAARDLGDARLTSFYYTFNGSQGDIFVNVATANFNGDVDVYAADGLRPLTKITFYADSALSETGRVIYLRKPEKLILRVEGRSPDDKPATFTIKFAGSFQAVQDNGATELPKLPEINTETTAGVRVNSVGTIIKTEPQPTPETKETVAENQSAQKGETQKDSSQAAENNVVAKTEESDKTNDINSDAEKDETEAVKPIAKNSIPKTRRGTLRTAIPSRRTNVPKKAVTQKEKAPPAPHPLENVRLIVLMKNGNKVEFQMPEVLRFTLNNGIYTIITKDGKIHRHSAIDVQKLTVE